LRAKEAFVSGDWNRELEQAVMRRAVTVHAVLWRLERSGVGMRASGEGVLELPRAQILAAGITLDDRMAIAPRLWASMERIHGVDAVSGSRPDP
jgi:hypothetical protein